MPVPDAGTPALTAINDFIRHLADREYATSTRRIRRHFLSEFLRHAENEAADDVENPAQNDDAENADNQTTGEAGKQETETPPPITVAELMVPARAHAWLNDAADGKTRTRTPLRGRDAAAYPNSMRVRIDTYNAFAEFLGIPERLDTRPPAAGYRLTPADTKRLLHDLTVRRPIYAHAVTAMRTAAVAALVADTERTVPELAHLQVRALHLNGDGDAWVDLPDDSVVRLTDVTVQILRRWLVARAAIIAELEGSDPGHLWIPVKPGRPRGGSDPVKPGITPAAVRTLHAAHRALVSQVLGTPLRPGAFREAGPSHS